MVNFIRLTSTTDFGSLEDPHGEKRMTVADIRSLRRQAQKQTTIQFSVARSIAKLISDVRSYINQVIAERNMQAIHKAKPGSMPVEERKYTAV